MKTLLVLSAKCFHNLYCISTAYRLQAELSFKCPPSCMERTSYETPLQKCQFYVTFTPGKTGNSANLEDRNLLRIPKRLKALFSSAYIQHTYTQFCSRIPTLKSDWTATETHRRGWQRQVWSGCESRGSTEKCAAWLGYMHAELQNTDYYIQNLLQSLVTVRTILSFRQQLLTDGFSQRTPSWRSLLKVTRIGG